MKSITFIIIAALHLSANIWCTLAGYIYILEEQDATGASTGRYKIGYTIRTAFDRRNELQTGNPDHLVMKKDWPVDDAEAVEIVVKRALNHDVSGDWQNVLNRNGRRTEWYVVTNYRNFKNKVAEAIDDAESSYNDSDYMDDSSDSDPSYSDSDYSESDTDYMDTVSKKKKLLQAIAQLYTDYINQ